LKKLKVLFYFLTFLFLVFLFKNKIYYHLFQYKKITERPVLASKDTSFTNYIHKQCPPKNPNEIKHIKEIIELALTITSTQLSFASTPGSVTSNQLIHSRQGNCILYASYFNIVCTKILQYYGYDKYYQCTHAVGKIYCGPFSMHAFTSDSFWKDHDYNIIKGNRNEIYAVDPSLYDYTGIRWVSCGN